jgi:micrococcal nuclease
MVNRRLVAGGYAHAYLKYPFERGDRFASLERKARRGNAGLWSEGMVASGSAEEAHQQSGAAESLPYDPSGPDRDCGDFNSHANAQAFFEAAGPGDPHRLDGDSDGEACESL